MIKSKCFYLLSCLVFCSGAQADQTRVPLCAKLLASPSSVKTALVATYLNLLEVLLTGIDEISPKDFAKLDLIEVKSTLLQRLSQTDERIDPFAILYEITKTDLTQHSTQLSVLAESTQLDAVAENLTEEDWQEIRQSLLQKATEFHNVQNSRNDAKTSAEFNFVDLPDFSGNTYLHRLLIARQYEQAYRLVASSSINTRYINHLNLSNRTALDIYIANGFEDLRIRQALSIKSAMTKDQLYSLDQELLEAASKNDSRRIQELYELGAIMYFDNKEVFIAHQNSVHRSLNRFRNGRIGDAITPLHKAIKNNHLETIKLLVKLGSNVNAFDDKGQTPFSLALDTWPDVPIEVIESLLSGNLELELKGRFPLNFNHLSLALKHEREDIMRLLVARGARENSHYILGANALDLLYSDKTKDIEDTLKWLLSLGVNINSQNSEGQTPLHWAVRNRNLVVIKALLAGGADPTIRDLYKGTPYFFVKHEKDEMAKAIRAELEKHTPPLWRRLRAKLTSRGQP